MSLYWQKLSSKFQCNEAEVARFMLDELIRSVVVERLEAYKKLAEGGNAEPPTES